MQATGKTRDLGSSSSEYLLKVPLELDSMPRLRSPCRYPPPKPLSRTASVSPPSKVSQQKVPSALSTLLGFGEVIKAPKKHGRDDVPDPGPQHNSNRRSQNPRTLLGPPCSTTHYPAADSNNSRLRSRACSSSSHSDSSPRKQAYSSRSSYKPVQRRPATSPRRNKSGSHS
jgi:hypothetical protein